MSLQAICVAACYNLEWPLLIVCPSSVTITWLEALYTWLSPRVLPKPQDIHVITSGKVCVSKFRKQRCKHMPQPSHEFVWSPYLGSQPMHMPLAVSGAQLLHQYWIVGD